nr:hypothetical protein [Sphingomonas sp. Y57]
MPTSLARMLSGETPTDEAAQLLRAIRMARGRFGDRALCEWLRDAADHLESGCLASLPALRWPKP